MKAWRNFETFAGKASFSTWLFSITRNTAINWAKRRTELPLPVGEEGELTLDPADTGQDGPEIAAIKKDVVAKLAVAMRKLSTKQREAVLLRKEGLSYQEIANRLSCNRETVKTRVRDGLEKLRRLLEQQGVERNTIFRSLTGQ
jgi:RNA polymerase sigma-70 factor (ECF subfamily)